MAKCYICFRLLKLSVTKKYCTFSCLVLFELDVCSFSVNSSLSVLVYGCHWYVVSCPYNLPHHILECYYLCVSGAFCVQVLITWSCVGCSFPWWCLFCVWKCSVARFIIALFCWKYISLNFLVVTTFTVVDSCQGQQVNLVKLDLYICFCFFQNCTHAENWTHQNSTTFKQLLDYTALISFLSINIFFVSRIHIYVMSVWGLIVMGLMAPYTFRECFNFYLELFGFLIGKICIKAEDVQYYGE